MTTAADDASMTMTVIHEAELPDGVPEGAILTAAVHPGHGLGPFRLGATINSVISILRQDTTTFGRAQLIYGRHNPLGLDSVVSLPFHGLKLRFDPASQRLKMIEVCDPRRLVLLYSDREFSSPTRGPVFEQVYHRFGPSHGQYDRGKRAYLLTYPGLTLVFPVPEEYEDAFLSKTPLDLTSAMKFPDGTQPLLSNVCVFQGADLDSPQTPGGGEGSPLHYYQPVRVVPGKGIVLTQQNIEVSFGDSCQDVMSSLGPPGDVYFKAEDKMRIHNPASHGMAGGDYLYNYFAHGIDLLFDARTHTVKKFVMHTNLPGHYDFNCYAKCNMNISLADLEGFKPAGAFTLQQDATVSSIGDLKDSVVDQQPGALEDVSELATVDLSDGSAASRKQVCKGGGNAPGKAAPRRQGIITPQSNWTDICDALGIQDRRPVAFSRAPTANTTNPFGPTEFHRFADLIFEVMSGGLICSVIMFRPTRHD